MIKYLIKRSFIGLINGQFKETLKKILKIILKKNKINLDDLNMKEFSLNELFEKFGSDKGIFDTKKTYDQLKKKINFLGITQTG